VKPTGTCDICKTNPATLWWGRTSAAICGKGACADGMYERWEEHSRKFEEQLAFEQSMKDEYGDY
jgi:hypothetical protein